MDYFNKHFNRHRLKKQHCSFLATKTLVMMGLFEQKHHSETCDDGTPLLGPATCVPYMTGVPYMTDVPYMTGVPSFQGLGF